jgi:type IV pilus assembly protein PilM
VPQFVRILPIDVATAAATRHVEVPAEVSVLDPTLELVPTVRARTSLRASVPNSGVSDLAARIRSTLAFFASRPTATPISQVLLTGAGAAVNGVLASISAAIDAPVRVVGAEDVIAIKAGRPVGDIALNVVSTIGIAMGEVR